MCAVASLTLHVMRVADLSTVLAQDHFYSDFLSLHVTVKTNNTAMMMFVLPCIGKDASGRACRLEDQP